VQNLKKLFYTALTCTFLVNLNIPANSTLIFEVELLKVN